MGRISAFYAMPHPPIVIPEVGKGEERKIKDTTDACYKIAEEIASIEPDTIIISYFPRPFIQGCDFPIL